MSDWLLLFLNKPENLLRILSTLERALKFLPKNCLLDQTANHTRQSVTLWSHCMKLCLTMEKAMAAHSSTLAWRIPWTEEPGRLQSMGLLRVGHNWATSLSPFTSMHWRRKWQPTQVFLPIESQRWGSLVGCSPWGRTELDTTEVT